jgi:hypothetical protein
MEFGEFHLRPPGTNYWPVDNLWISMEFGEFNEEDLQI